MKINCEENMKQPKFIQDKEIIKYISVIEHCELIFNRVEELFPKNENAPFSHKIIMYSIIKRTWVST